MITYAEAEHYERKDIMRKIAKVEEESGMKTGVRFSDRGRHMVKVQFYPKIQFFIADADVEGNVVSEYRILTREEFDTTRGLQL